MLFGLTLSNPNAYYVNLLDLLCFNIQGYFQSLIHVGDSFDDFEPCFPRVVIHLCHFLKFFYWTDPCSICTITSSSFLSSCCTRSEYSSEWIIIVSKKSWGFAEHCWTTLTLLHRSCYCRSFSSYHWSDFR